MKLFEPGRIGRLSLKNRIVMAPMGTGGLAVELDGRLSQQGIDYFVTRAKGGVGLIITCVTRASREIEQLPNMPFVSQLMADNRLYVTRLSQLADAVHDYGAKVAIQLTAGIGRAISTGYLSATGAIPVAPSTQRSFWDPNVMARELTLEQIERLIQAFGFAAEIVASAGIDAIELHGHEGYLLDQFKTALWNKRTDKYGGNLAGRLRFSVEAIEAIKRGAGIDLPVLYRFGLTHYLEGGREIKEGIEIARRLEATGVDALHIDAGCYETPYWPHPPTYQPPGCMVGLAEIVKNVVNIPVIAVGKLGYPEVAERVLQEGKADFIALGRPLLSDAEWPNKVKEARLEDICPCVGCHECLTRVMQHKYISCAVNPAAGMETELVINPARNKKSVLVVGGGPAGMQAARVAALRGHSVTLWEKAGVLGGNLIPASVPDFKQDYRRLKDYLATQVNKVGVSIEFGKEATPKLICAMKPDVVFVAIGSTRIPPEIPGIGKWKAVSAVDLLLGNSEVGKSVVILDGGPIGCETALYLSQQSKKLTVVEKKGKIARHLPEVNRQYLLKLLDDANVKILIETRVLAITGEGITISDKYGKRDSLKADSVVFVPDLKPNGGLFEALKDKVSEVYAIGDCVEPRKVKSAIWEGFRIARLV